MNEIIQVKGVKKRFGNVEAVRGIDFSIKEGICFGLLGPNGAGKTTTIEIMEGIQTPDEGQILFRGTQIDQKFKEKVGIQFQHTALPEFITVKETLEMFSSFYPDPRPLEEVIELCSLDDIIGRDNQKLSGGQKQRMLLALAILPRPELVFLDEPTTGLDPQSRRNFWDLIRRIKAENTTVLLTTHYMDEAQALCDEIAIMDQGRIMELDTPEALLGRHFDGALVRIPWKEGFDREQGDRVAASDRVKRIPGEISLTAAGFEIQTAELDTTIKILLDAGINIDGLGVHSPNLEDLFLKLTGTSLRG